MKTDNQRREFEFALETLLKACDSKVKSVKVNWDEKDTEFRESAESVTITYNNDYKKRNKHRLLFMESNSVYNDSSFIKGGKKK